MLLLERVPHIQLQTDHAAHAVLDQPLSIGPGRRLPSPEHPRSDHAKVAYRRAEIIAAGTGQRAPRYIDAARKEKCQRAHQHASRRKSTIFRHCITFSTAFAMSPRALAAASTSAIQ